MDFLNIQEVAAAVCRFGQRHNEWQLAHPKQSKHGSPGITQAAAVPSPVVELGVRLWAHCCPTHAGRESQQSLHSRHLASD